MSTLQALVHRLEAYAQEELDLQTRTLAMLREQESALFHGNLAAMQTNMELIDAQLKGAAARTTRRHEILRSLGVEFGVAPSTLSLSSICTRLGRNGERLARIAIDLRAATLCVSRSTRRLSALARMHARLNDEILGTLLADRGVDHKDMARCGVLVNAEV